MISLLTSWFAAASILFAHAEVGMATTFSAAEGAPYNPNPHLCCQHRDLDDRRDLVVAHKTLPCGTELLILLPRTGRYSFATVEDRGPARAMLDLAPALRKKLKHNGRERVVMFVLGVPRTRLASAP